jgi:hypothetical protein
MALPDGALALGAGTVLALGAAVLVLGPLLREDVMAPPRRRRVPNARAARAESGSAVDALREIEFDRATGKLSDDDYRSLKASYTREALAELRARDAAAAVVTAGASDDEVEAAIRRYRASSHVAVCPVDGTRPEPDALFCSACGRYLPGRCPTCGAACEDTEQRYCSACGDALAG